MVFEQVKSAVDMRTVVEGYGLCVNRSDMVLCPFYQENTPYAKIYPGSFHCFGYGEHLDVIRFTQKLFRLDKPIEAVKKLNDDYGLHIEVSRATTSIEISEYQKRAAERKKYEAWEHSAWNTLNIYL